MQCPLAAQSQPQYATLLILCDVVACSTNMAISDAGKLGAAISQHGGDLQAALQEYQQERLPQTAKEVRYVVVDGLWQLALFIYLNAVT